MLNLNYKVLFIANILNFNSCRELNFTFGFDEFFFIVNQMTILKIELLKVEVREDKKMIS